MRCTNLLLKKRKILKITPSAGGPFAKYLFDREVGRYLNEDVICN